MVRWGILGVSMFATRRMVPAMQRGRDLTVAAIASRSKDKAEKAARDLNIPRAYGSYEELLADPEIDAVYIPLPNHMHVPYSIKAAEAGKHVLCEKPIALNAAEARALLDARDRTGVLIQEAAMIRVHPRWLATRAELAKGSAGKIGELRSIVSSFGYHLRQRDNVRYRRDMGGGTLLDVGFYPVSISRFCFGAEPTRVLASLTTEPETGVDILAAAMLEFAERAFDLQLRHAAVAIAAGRADGRQGAHQLRRALEPVHRPAHAPDHRSQRAAGRADGGIGRVRAVQPVHAAGRGVLAGGDERRGRRRCRSRTA